MQRAIWTIVTEQDFLRLRSTKVAENSMEARALIQDLMDTWTTVAAHGIAAPQIGVSRRGFIYHTMEDPEPRPLLNPKILRAWGEIKDYDGCLSVPGVYGTTRRAEHVELTGYDGTGKRVRLHFSGFDARIIQHEFDHLDGILFIDRLDTLDDLYVIARDPSPDAKADDDDEEDTKARVETLSTEQQTFIAEHQRPLPTIALRW